MNQPISQNFSKKKLETFLALAKELDHNKHYDIVCDLWGITDDSVEKILFEFIKFKNSPATLIYALEKRLDEC